MKPNPKLSNADLLVWASGVLARAQDNKMHGKIVVHVEGGRITRVMTEANELPPSLVASSVDGLGKPAIEGKTSP